MFQKFFSGYKNGEYDLWRLKKEKTLQVDFIGDVRGAGLPEKDMFDYQGTTNSQCIFFTVI